MGSDSSSKEAAWKQSTASPIRLSSLWTNPKEYHAMQFVGSILNASESKILATESAFEPIFVNTALIKILQGT